MNENNNNNIDIENNLSDIARETAQGNLENTIDSTYSVANPTLLSRVIDKVKAVSQKPGSRKLLKALVAMVSSATIATSVAGCGLESCSTSSTPGTSYTDETDKNNSTDGADTDTDENNSSSSSTSYSDIFKAVLNGSDYSTRNSNIDHNSNGVGTYSSLSQKYMEIPFGFTDSDFDAQGIYNDELECESVPYFVGDDTKNLYLSVRAEHTHDATQTYYTCYILKYTLSNKEYEELTDVYTSGTLLAPFYIQELSKHKTPTIVNKVKLTKSVYEGILKYVQGDSTLSSDVFGSKNVGIDLIEYSDPDLRSLDDQYLSINVRSSSAPTEASYKKYNYINSGEVRNLKLNSTDYYVGVLSDNNEVVKNPVSGFYATNTEEYLNDENATQIMYYCTCDATCLSSYNVDNYLSNSTK